MNILELAKEYATITDLALEHEVIKCNCYLFPTSMHLEAFSAAISTKAIEEYKAGLVPVAWVYGATLATKYQYNHIYLGDVAIPQPEWETLCSLPKEKP